MRWPSSWRLAVGAKRGWHGRLQGGSGRRTELRVLLDGCLPKVRVEFVVISGREKAACTAAQACRLSHGLSLAACARVSVGLWPGKALGGRGHALRYTPGELAHLTGNTARLSFFTCVRQGSRMGAAACYCCTAMRGALRRVA